jgi:hypothetical protein
MAWDPDFIDFIDAYCDRWCERCPLTHKCAAFARENDPEGIDDCSEAVEKAMETLREELAMPPVPARPWLDEMFNVPEPDEKEVEEYHRGAKARRERRNENPMMASALDYLIESFAWLRMCADATKANIERALVPLGNTVESVVAKLETDDVLDALEVVAWDSTLISAKLNRALAMRDETPRVSMAIRSKRISMDRRSSYCCLPSVRKPGGD